MKKLLSLDASTKTVGFCIWSKETCELIEISHWSVPQKDTLLEKVLEFEKWLKEDILVRHSEIDEVVIEEAFVAMFGGNSSSKTTTTLSQANFGYQLICYKLGLKIDTMTVTDSRKYAFPTAIMKKNTGVKQKEQMFAYVLAELGESYFPTRVVTRGKDKGKTVYEDFVLDCSDAYITGKGYINKTIKKTKRVR